MHTRQLLALVLLGCGGDNDASSTPVDAVAPQDVTVTVAPNMPTVLVATWTTPVEASGYVRFTVDGVERTTMDVAEGTEHQALLVGLPPEAEVSVEVVASSEGGELAAPAQVVSTGTLVGAPTFTVEGESDQFVALGLVDDDKNTIVVLDPQGRVVWMHEDERALAVFRAHIALDGSGVVYTATLKDGKPNADSLVVKVPWDGGPETTLAVPYLAHDFVELDDGALVSLAYEFRDEIEGNKLVRIEPDGTYTTIWSAWDCFDPAVNLSIDLEHGWTHTNALDRSDDGFLVGARNLTSIIKVEADGTCSWGFGGAAGTVDVSGPSFFHQHQFDHFDGGMLVFDNDGAPGNESRVIEYVFDEQAGTASLARVIQSDPVLYSFILGDVHRLDDGDTLITWSVPNTIDRMSPDGARVWRLEADNEDLIFGFTEVMADPGRPDLGVMH